MYPARTDAAQDKEGYQIARFSVDATVLILYHTLLEVECPSLFSRGSQKTNIYILQKFLV